jgi:hypothetical protein
MSNLEVVGAANVLAGTTGLGLAGALAAAVSRQSLNEAAVSALDAKNQSRDRAATGFEIYPATSMATATATTLTSGRQVYVFFKALSTAAITSIKTSVGGTAATTTTHSWMAIYDVDTSVPPQPTTLLATSTDLTTGFTTANQGMYATGSLNNTWTISWTPATLNKTYALGILWIGTGSVVLRGRILDGTSSSAGYSTVAGTAFTSQSNATGLTAVVPTGTPAETQANLRTNALGSQPNAWFG